MHCLKHSCTFLTSSSPRFNRIDSNLCCLHAKEVAQPAKTKATVIDSNHAELGSLLDDTEDIVGSSGGSRYSLGLGLGLGAEFNINTVISHVKDI